MKLRKILVLVLAVAMCSVGMLIPVTAQAASPVLADGYQFIDTCYHNGIYLAMAKKLGNDNTAVTMYKSTDGENWVKTKDLSAGYGGGIQHSRQNLVWWEAQNVFVASAKGYMYKSADGETWTTISNLQNKSNGIIETNGTELIATYGGATPIYRVINDLTTPPSEAMK